jgi:hypothetical protein
MTDSTASAAENAHEDEGYLKFLLSWEETEIRIPETLFKQLQTWRDRLYAAGLVGAYPDGIGFGNISIRSPEASGAPDDRRAVRPHDAPVRFFITGSATGNYEHLAAHHYALVTAYSLERNTLACQGLSKASSESLSHAAIYEAASWVKGVIHIHSARIWERFRGELPTTPPGATYGTPEMAFALQSLATRLGQPFHDGSVVAGAPASGDRSPSDSHPPERVIIMGGHEEGVISFGETLEEAGNAVMQLLEQVDK